ncbi:MAG: hypothetical protein JWM57_4121 [Phycisphaerales bacterium]|nr:hypothetical protein [Phycisphaerales bacterium]
MSPIKILLTLLCLSTAMFAQQIETPGGDDGDLAGGAAVGVTTWEPMITEFYAAAEHGTDAVVRKREETNALGDNQKREDILGELNQWRALKPKIVPRPAGPAGSQAYTDKEAVISAWQRVANKEGRIEFITYGSNGTPPQLKPGETAKPPGIHTIWTLDHRLLFSCDVDVVTNATAVKKDRMLNDYFKMKQFKITAVKVSDDITHFRDAIPQDAPEIPLYGLKEDTGIYADYRSLAHSLARPQGMLTVDLLNSGIGIKGVWEFRVKVVVLGKIELADEFQEKTVDGAVRLAFVGDQKLDLSILNFDGQRKSGEKDDFIVAADGRVLRVPKRPAANK